MSVDLCRGTQRGNELDAGRLTAHVPTHGLGIGARHVPQLSKAAFTGDHIESLVERASIHDGDLNTAARADKRRERIKEF